MEERIAALYRPLLAEQVALSPDGEHLAYTRHERGELAIYVMAVNRTEKKYRIVVERDRAVAFSKEGAPARLRFLRWTTVRRLVFAPTEYHNGARMIGPIYAANCDATEPKELVTADDFAILTGTPEELPKVNPRPTTIVGFKTGDRNTLLVEARGKRTNPPDDPIPTALCAINVTTGKMATLAEDDQQGRFIYDQQGRMRLLYQHPLLSHTRTFLYQSGEAWGRWTASSEAWGGPVAPQFRVTVENYYGERAFPLRFDANPKILYFASNVGRDTYGVYALDLETKRQTDLTVEEPHVDLASLEPGLAGGRLVFDDLRGTLVGVRAFGLAPFTRWVDAEFTRLQTDVERKFPQRAVEILQWDDARQRLLLRVTGGAEPGRYYVYQRTENVIVEVLRRAPWLRNADLHGGATFAFDTAAGVHLTGHLTFPRKPRLNPPPLLIDFSDGLMARPRVGFDPDAQAFAEMGFVVARINHRGSDGFGRKHRDAIHAGIDRVPVDDALAVIDWVTRHHAIDRKRIATVGRRLGGYLALRAVQLEPAMFRCAVAIEAPLDPRAWLQPPVQDMMPAARMSAQFRGLGMQPQIPPQPLDFEREALWAFLAQGDQLRAERSVLRTAELLTKPVMLVTDPLRDRTMAAQNLELRSKLKRLGRPAEYVEVGSGYAANIPAARARVFKQIEEFFNLNLYDYNVKVGPARAVE